MVAQRILLLDDERDVGELFDLALRGAGYLVDFVTKIPQAHARLDAFKYALAIADFRLPDGNGLEILERAAQSGTKTYVLSGYLFQIPPALTARHEVLMKPIRPGELLAAVYRAIGPAETGP